MELVNTYVVTTAGSPSGIAATASATAIWENKSKSPIWDTWYVINSLLTEDKKSSHDALNLIVNNV